MSARLLGIAEPGTQMWNDMHALGISASQLASVLGLSPWLSPFTLWHIKAGLVEQEEIGSVPAVHWGTVLEAPIADEFARQHPEFGVEPAGTFQSVQRPWQIATPDRLLYEAGHGLDPLSGLEIKAVRSSDGWGDPGSDEIPIAYRCQVMQQMDVLGLDTWHVAVLIGGQDYREYQLTRDDADVALIREAGEAFWRSVEQGTPPDVDALESTTRTLRALHPDMDDVDVTVPDDAAVFYEQACAALDAAKDDKQLAVNQLLRAIGTGRRAVTADGRRIATRVITTPRRLDTAALKADHPDLVATYTKAGEPQQSLRPATTRKAREAAAA